MENLAKLFYDFLKTKEYFKNTPQLDPEVEWLIKDRENCQRYSNFRILSFLKPPYKPFFDLCKQFDPFQSFKNELDIMPYNLLTGVALSQFEGLKRIFCIALDFEKLGIKSKSNPTYGMFITRLSERGLEKNIVNALDNKLRNIIAHNDWYVQNKLFTYVEKEKQTISQEKLSQRIDNFTYFSNKFYNLYWHDFLPSNTKKFAEKKLIEDT